MGTSAVGIPSTSVSFNRELQLFECGACLDSVPVRRGLLYNPEAFAEFREMVELDHSQCAKYSDVRMARNARKFRKESTRLMLISGGRA